MNRVVAVWGNSNFTCEIAHELGRKKAVIVFDLNFLEPDMMELFNLKNVNPFGNETLLEYNPNKNISSIEKLMEAVKVKALNSRTFEALASKAKGANVWVVEGLTSIFKYEYVDMDLVSRVIQESMKYYDFVVLNLNQHIYDSGTVLGFVLSDVILRPFAGSLAEVKNFNGHVRFLKNRAPEVEQKLSAVGYCGSAHRAVDSDFLRESVGVLAGCVDNDTPKKRMVQIDGLLKSLHLKERDYVSDSVLQ